MKRAVVKLCGLLALGIVLLQMVSPSQVGAHANKALTVGRQSHSVATRSAVTEARRKRAIMRGLNFIYRTSLVRENFEDYGGDFLWCFYTLSEAVLDEDFRREARRMGVERAREWRREHPNVPPHARAALISDLVFGNDAAESLGVRDEKFRDQLKLAAVNFKARDYLLFDPVNEPPPLDVPDECEYCGAFDNPRGGRICHECHRPLKMRTRYDVWYDALIITYSGDRTGIELGAHYVDVLRWLPTMRPYVFKRRGSRKEFFDAVYAVTHVVYTLNDYSRYNLSPRLLPQEFAFLKANLKRAIATNDADMLGEMMDSLRAFGEKSNDALMHQAMEYYLSHQNTDGSWGDRREKDIYLRYHPTWNAIAGLSEYAWKGEGFSFPEVRPLLEGTADKTQK
jgi:hypothetical protein